MSKSRLSCLWLVAGCSTLLACGEAPAGTEKPSGGGAQGSGGAATSGGAAGSSAGTSAAGSGGFGGSGTGGSGTGGSGTGGSGTGGSGADAGAGGATAGTGGESGGAGAGGTGGDAAGGTAGDGGTGTGGGGAGGAGGSGGPTRSAGCGSQTPRQGGRFTIQSGGTAREYILRLPDNYNSNTAYRLIFGWHWRGGTAQDVAGNSFGGAFYGLASRANGTAIFVAPEGLVDNGVTGWANPQGRDIAFLDAMLERFRSELCIDESRIFSTGFSYGGMMSFAVGCARGNVFRAIAPFAGALYSGCENGSAPVAMWGSHGYGSGADGVVPIANGRSGRDVFLQRNGCGNQTVPVAPDECVSYQGCRDGYPVTWCEWNGGHTVPNFAGQAVWDFFSQF
jgi:polyhydroxybutyrate depolymerase